MYMKYQQEPVYNSYSPGTNEYESLFSTYGDLFTPDHPAAGLNMNNISNYENIEDNFRGGNPYRTKYRGLLINKKQLYWIQKRRARRVVLDSIMMKQKNNYMHESRHKHAMKRLRAPSGRFLTKEEMAKINFNNEDTCTKKK